MKTYKFTKAQCNAMSYLHEKCAAQYPSFGGFNGYEGHMEIVGVSNPDAVWEFIQTIKLPSDPRSNSIIKEQLISAKKSEILERQAIQELKDDGKLDADGEPIR